MHHDIEITDVPTPSPTDVPAATLICCDVLETVRELLEDLFPETISMFLQDTSARLEELQKAIVQQDLHTVSQIAHILKGSSGNLGAMRFSALCQQVMSLSEAGLLADVTRQAVEMTTEFVRMRVTLEQLCQAEASETATVQVQ